MEDYSNIQYAIEFIHKINNEYRKLYTDASGLQKMIDTGLSNCWNLAAKNDYYGIIDRAKWATPYVDESEMGCLTEIVNFLAGNNNIGIKKAFLPQIKIAIQDINYLDNQYCKKSSVFARVFAIIETINSLIKQIEDSTADSSNRRTFINGENVIIGSTISNCAFNSGIKEEAPQKNDAEQGNSIPLCSAENGGSPVNITDQTELVSNGAGRPKSTLFTDDGIKTQEANRVKKFVEDNMLLGVKWNTRRENTMRKMVVCFYKKWVELGFVEETQYPSPAPVVNFFINECGIQTDVSVDTLKNNTKPWKDEIDEDMMEKVCAIFPQ